MIPRLANRPPSSRPAPGTMGQPRLESLAAELALLAQRRSRAIHEIETLDRQRGAAAVNFATLQKRIAWLMQKMDALSPELRDPDALADAPAISRAQAPAANQALAEIGRQWIAAAQASQADRSIRPRRGKRP